MLFFSKFLAVLFPDRFKSVCVCYRGAGVVISIVQMRQVCKMEGGRASTLEYV